MNSAHYVIGLMLCAGTVTLMSAMMIAIWAEESGDASIQRYLLPTCVFVFISVLAGGYVFLGELSGAPILLFERGFTYRDTEVLYFDVTSIKFGFDDENDFYRKGDAMAALACGDRIAMIEEQTGYLEQCRRDNTVYIALRTGELLELESALKRYRRSDLELLAQRIRDNRPVEVEEAVGEEYEAAASVYV